MKSISAEPFGLAIDAHRVVMLLRQPCVQAVHWMILVITTFVFVEGFDPRGSVPHCLLIFRSRLAGHHWVRSFQLVFLTITTMLSPD